MVPIKHFCDAPIHNALKCVLTNLYTSYPKSKSAHGSQPRIMAARASIFESLFGLHFGLGHRKIIISASICFVCLRHLKCGDT